LQKSRYPSPADPTTRQPFFRLTDIEQLAVTTVKSSHELLTPFPVSVQPLMMSIVRKETLTTSTSQPDTLGSRRSGAVLARLVACDLHRKRRTTSDEGRWACKAQTLNSIRVLLDDHPRC
jgi:hypothetical protein